MNLDLSGKRALVCGSTAGIGRACAMELASMGASITLAARDEVKLKGVLGGLPRPRQQTHDLIVADFGKPDEAAKAVEGKLDPANPWHILINNTGGPPAGATLDASPENLVAAFNAQLVTAHRLVVLLLPGFKSAGYGRVINITSTSVKQPIPNLAISNIVRPAVAAWGKGLANELGPFGVTVNNVLPGYTATERLGTLIAGRAGKQGISEDQVRAEFIAATPARRLGQPEEIAAAVAFLASPAAGYINGINLPVDGGRLGTL